MHIEPVLQNSFRISCWIVCFAVIGGDSESEHGSLSKSVSTWVSAWFLLPNASQEEKPRRQLITSNAWRLISREDAETSAQNCPGWIAHRLPPVLMALPSDTSVCIETWLESERQASSEVTASNGRLPPKG